MHMNKHTVRDINLLSNYEEFFEKFTEIIILLLLNFFSNYDQIELYSDSQDMMIFMTFFELLWQIILYIKMMNLSVQFSQKIIQMLNFNILHNAEVFIDNIEIKKSKTKYYNKKSLSKVCCFVLEYLQTLNCIFLTLKLTNVKISEEKSHFDQSEIVIIEYLCNYKRRHLKAAKISKIMNWSSCKNIIEVRIFIKICIYYQIWIENFTIIMQSIFVFFKKNQTFI